MKTLLKPTLFLILILITSCESETIEDLVLDQNQDGQSESTNSDVEEENNDSDENEESGENDPETPTTTSLRTFIFGHSLVYHDPPAIATPSNETSVPHWMADFANTSGYDYEVSGQYGFLTSHRNLPPVAQWGFDIADSAWDSDNESFENADFNSVLLTAGNFIQYQPASENYYNESFSPIDATLEIFDWCANQESEIQFFVYENWPDMAGFITGQDFPPSENEFADYNAFTQGDFHQWWLEYHDTLIASRPGLNIKMIPVGPILSGLLTETELLNIEITELYEDNAPHGRPTIYFLAGLITYMGMYGTQPPSNYEVPNTVDSIVAENYQMAVNYIWEALEDFNFENGESRVFQ